MQFLLSPLFPVPPHLPSPSDPLLHFPSETSRPPRDINPHDIGRCNKGTNLLIKAGQESPGRGKGFQEQAKESEPPHSHC